MTQHEQKSKNRCDIVVPVYNSPRQVRACIKSILDTIENGEYRLVIINDRSDEYTSAYLRSLEDITLIENESNLGFLGSANKGLLYSDSHYVCLLNSDTIITDPNWLNKMIAYADRNPDVGLVSPVSNEAVNLSVKLHPGADINLMADLVDQHSMAKYPDAVTIIGSCLLVRRRVVDTIGGFDEPFGKGYCEESDYHFRAREAGFACKIADDVFYYHEGEASFSGERDSRYTKNRALFDKRWSGQYTTDIQEFNEKNALGYLRNDQFILHHPTLHDEYDILFLLPSLETYGGVIVVVDIVNELIRKKIKANIVCLNQTSKPIEFGRYFEPLIIPEDKIKSTIPKSKLYAATHYRTAYAAYSAAKRHDANAYYLIQDDERLFENEDVDLAEASYRLIPNHVYVSHWLNDDIGPFADFTRVISNGIYQDLFYPRQITFPHTAEIPGKTPDVVIAMMTRTDIKRGFHEGITAINRLLVYTPFPEKLIFHFFGNREVLSHEINTKNYTYHGVINRTEVAKIMRESDIFIDPSHFQGFGLTALEAMSSGCACIMPKDGGGADFVKHMENALFFKGGDIDHLFQMLQLLLSNVFLRQKLQKNCLRTITKKFSVYYSVNEYEYILKNMDLLADLPDLESIPHLKYRLILAENERYSNARKDVQIDHLQSELNLIRQKLHHYITLYMKHKSGSKND